MPTIVWFYVGAGVVFLLLAVLRLDFRVCRQPKAVREYKKWLKTPEGRDYARWRNTPNGIFAKAVLSLAMLKYGKINDQSLTQTMIANVQRSIDIGWDFRVFSLSPEEIEKYKLRIPEVKARYP